MSIYLAGLISSLVQIVAIGAQNTFVLRSGLIGRVLIPIIICSLCDVLLISFGVFGIAELVTKNKIIMNGLQYFGAVFLFYYSYNSIKRSIKGGNILDVTDSRQPKDIPGLKIALSAIFVSLINPHAWLDAVVVIGALASEYIDFHERFYFYLGAITASIIWFSSLGLMTRFLIPIFKKPLSWKILDFLIGVFMFILAIKLLI